MLSPSAVYNLMLNSPTRSFLFDLRPQEAFDAGHILGVTHIPFPLLPPSSSPSMALKLFEDEIRKQQRLQTVIGQWGTVLTLILPENTDVDWDPVQTLLKTVFKPRKLFVLEPPFSAFHSHYGFVCTPKPMMDNHDLLIESLPNEIVPGLFLGGSPLSDSVKFFESMHITHIINCMERDDYPIPPGVQRLELDLDDVPSQQIQFEPALDLLEKVFNMTETEVRDHLKTIPHLSPIVETLLNDSTSVQTPFPYFPNGIRVFVHCYVGMSRSASVVIAFLIRKYRLSPINALRMCKIQRNIVRPNDGFVRQLCQFWINEGEPDEPPPTFNSLEAPTTINLVENIFTRALAYTREKNAS
ncbi:putative Dual specificity phosphatase, catalytic domain containing protein [Blattamonas nauphoetae]|uniref:protein-tyrosine-phosphatase n=1 Tax=Blattamonas nauphoetae TaxID=2049346 RepID=A0ABQ9YHY2_9EUKA|nr:putative Dual specificity phosphatase, catalytic domain containing protein [Blattamonas nauphoetae]